MRLLVCGDRNWTNKPLVYQVILDLWPKVVIEGRARGADQIGGLVADQLGLPHLVFPALWDAYGRAAGPIRNQQMIDKGRPNLIVAFHNHIEQSAGTANMLIKAEAQEIPYTLVTE